MASVQVRHAFRPTGVCFCVCVCVCVCVRTGINSPDPVCARHSLALAALVARETSGVTFGQYVGPYLQNNVEMAKRTGALLWSSEQACHVDAMTLRVDSPTHVLRPKTHFSTHIRTCA